MSDDAERFENGSKDRATVAIVNAKIDTVLARIEGHARTTTAQLDGMSKRLDGLDPLPAQMAALHERQTLTEARIVILEADKRRESDWKRGPLFGALVAFAIALLTVGASVAVQLIAGA